jgi:hypothetical protein
MAENKGRPGGRLGTAKTGSRRAASKTPRLTRTGPGGAGAGRKRNTDIKPAGRGGRAQQAGGPGHQGLDGHEDRNP